MRDRVVNLASWLILSMILVVPDQFTKAMAVVHLKNQDPYVILDGILELLYSENRGAAFGMLQGMRGFFFVIAILVMVAGAYVMYRMPSWSNSRYHYLKLCIIMITAGAVGNMIDRGIQGYVVDFIYFKLIDFPIFNLADIYVTVATAFLLLLLSLYYKEEELEVFSWKKRS